MRAVRELTAIFSCQWSNGMLPQIRFVPGGTGYRPDADDWGVTEQISGPTRFRTSGITQPPIMGLCAYKVFEKLAEEERAAYRDDFLAICEGLDRFHDWLLRERDPMRENLVVCLHPWETGTDNSPAFDALIDTTRRFVADSGLPVDTFGRADTANVKSEQRPTDRDYYAYFGLLALFRKHNYDQAEIIRETPFLLQDVLFNCLFDASLGATASLQDALALSAGLGQDKAASLRERAEDNRQRRGAVYRAINDKLWDEESGLYFSYDARGDSLLRTPTVSSLMPLLGGIAGGDRGWRLIEHLANPGEFWPPVPVPSTSMASRAFNPVRYWSGPSWPVTNWLLVDALAEWGVDDLYASLVRSTVGMTAEGVGLEEVRQAAASVLELNSFGEEYTTPSRKQYAHAWLWDSAIVAVSWPLVESKPQPYTGGADDKPGFWEYYHPNTGEPLGAKLMSWTASLFLELFSLIP